MSRKRRRDVLRHVPVIGRDAARAHFEAILNEPPPESPTAPWREEPPAWMLKPVPVHDMRGEPVQWIDEAPHAAWAARAGKAKYELMKMDAPKKAEGQAQNDLPSWMGPQGRRMPLEELNHPANLMTVQERQQKGLTGPWNSRPAPDPAEDKMARESRDITCTVAPWWDE
ncbi:hypothetical protein [Streptomyces sp. NBC_00105]|uniref:hypothetical protein n=1 Tax=Streptomyces sp. NBC_00105 TaxID=2903622 RepID=UPI00324E22BB